MDSQCVERHLLEAMNAEQEQKETQREINTALICVCSYRNT